MILFFLACSRSESTFSTTVTPSNSPGEEEPPVKAPTNEAGLNMAVQLYADCSSFSEDTCPAPLGGGENAVCETAVANSILTRENLIAADLPSNQSLDGLAAGTVPFYFIVNQVTDYDLNLFLGVIVFDATDTQIATALGGNFVTKLEEYGISSQVCDYWELGEDHYDIADQTEATLSYGVATDDSGDATTHALCDRSTPDGITLTVAGATYAESDYAVEPACTVLEDNQRLMIDSASDLVQYFAAMDPDDYTIFPLGFYYDGNGNWYVFKETGSAGARTANPVYRKVPLTLPE